MRFDILKKFRQRWSKIRTPSGPKQAANFRPKVEALEERVVPTTRVWTGVSNFSNHWSDQFNWSNGVPQPGDSVRFPADAKQRTNVVDIDLTTGEDSGSGLVILRALTNLHIEGGNYDISGTEIDLTGKLSSDSGNNTIHDFLSFVANSTYTIDVGSGSLSLTGEVAGTRDGTSCIVGSPDLVKTGAGTLGVANNVGVGVPSDPCSSDNTGEGFDVFTVQQGLLSLDAGGDVLAELHVGNGAIVRLQQGGDQIAGPVTIDAGGVMDLNGHSEGLGTLTLNGAITTGAAGTLVIDGDVTTNANSTAVISGRVELSGTASTNRTFTVANGTNPDDLFINGIIQGAAKLIKDGAGRLTLTGTAPNTYTGLTQVKAGVLNLAKPDFFPAIVGTLLIGDSVSASNNARVLLDADDQILNSAEVRVNASGLLDLQGHDEVLSGLILAGNVTTGAGLLSLLGDVTTESVARMPIISGKLSLRGTRVFNVVDAVAGTDTDLTVDAVIVDGGVTKAGAGTMLMSGANTYTGSTTVNAGTLVLGSPGGVMVHGSLIVGDGAGGVDADKVVLSTSNLIADGAAVNINSSGVLDLNGKNEKFGSLTLIGGHITTGTGLLTLSSDVTVATAPTVATLSGRLSLNGPARVFNVASSVSGTDLLVDAAIENGGLTKSGAGTMELTGTSSYSGTTVVNEGQLVVNGTLSNSLVQLNGGLLKGGGAVKGINAAAGKIDPGDHVNTLTSTANVALAAGVSFQPQVIPLAPDPHDLLKVQGTVNLGGAGLNVQATFLTAVPPPIPATIDDSSTNFTATGGFSVFTGANFGFFNINDHFVAGVAGGAEQATWTFQNLQPGSYRVSASWGLGATNRATNAPYTIQDSASPVRVNQQVTSAEFSKFGIGWDSLGIVQVTGTSLTVRLTNDANGVVVADAILIEPRQILIIDNDDTDPVVGKFANLPTDGATVSAVATTVINGQVVQQVQQYTISYKAGDGNDVGLAYITTATAAQNLLITPAAINEGQRVTLTGHLTDPDAGDFLTLTIAWGDGATETRHPGTADFAFTHRYLDNPTGQPHGAYTVHLTWFDQHNAGNSRDLSVTVHNVAPTVFVPTQVAVQTGGMLVVPGYFTDPGVLDHWTATVDFGDGTGVQTIKLNPAGHFVLKHRYDRPGSYQVTVRVTDDDGESGLATLLVRVDSVKGKAKGKS